MYKYETIKKLSSTKLGIVSMLVKLAQKQYYLGKGKRKGTGKLMNYARGLML